jgi:hypothetical protein
MDRYRIEKIGYSFFVQYYGIVNFDGILDYDWKNIAHFDSKQEAKIYIERQTKKNKFCCRKAKSF